MQKSFKFWLSFFLLQDKGNVTAVATESTRILTTKVEAQGSSPLITSLILELQTEKNSNKSFPKVLSWRGKCEIQLRFNSCIWCSYCARLPKREVSWIFHVCSYMCGRRFQDGARVGTIPEVQTMLAKNVLIGLIYHFYRNVLFSK